MTATPWDWQPAGPRRSELDASLIRLDGPKGKSMFRKNKDGVWMMLHPVEDRADQQLFAAFLKQAADMAEANFAAGDFGSGFPDYNGTVPRSATLVITREDGGVIGA